MPRTPEERLRDLANAHALAAIAARDGIVVLMLEVHAVGRAAALELGWDGSSTLWELPERSAATLATSAKGRGDTVTVRWLRRLGGPPRALVFDGRRMLLMNRASDGEWQPEPGSLDTKNLS